ncbi:MAG: carotenoid 1,2-hydratase, partial [Gammaproteobacteria bacterium]
MLARRRYCWRWAVHLLTALIALGGAGEAAGGPPKPGGGNRPTVSVIDALGSGESAGFRRAYAPRTLHFPDDHGPHPDFRTEWWYFTGNLVGGDGRRFGFQLTFFRFALAPQQTPPAETSSAEQRASAWGTRQVYMAHFALTDVAGEHFQAAERFSRDALGLAGAQAKPFRVWLEDWRAQGDVSGPGALELTARTEDMGIELTLQGGKPLVLHGERGLSRKSAEPGNASYYYSRTRLPAAGRVWVGGRAYEVTGEAWLDREWGTSTLGAEQAGWDWFALQLSDGRELMFYQLRRKGGGVDPMSAGTLVSTDGSARGLNA